jgi:formate-dependent nitrite reductase membrane component NrfD
METPMITMPYEWMVSHTPQRRWIDGKGVLLWLAFFFIELGAGLYLVSLFAESLAGMALGWVLCILVGGALHLAFLGKPSRFWRGILRPNTSWISRGLIFVILFSALGVVQIAPPLLAPGAAPYSSHALAFKILLAPVSFVLVIYAGFAMNYVNALPLWNTALLPVLYMVASLWGGLEVLLGLRLLTGNAATATELEPLIRLFMIGYVVLVFVYLWSALYATTTAAKESVRRVLRGPLAPTFYVGVVLVGMIVPLVISGFSYSVGIHGPTVSLFHVGILAGLVGDLAVRYCLLKGAVYAPLIRNTTG